MPFRFTTVLVSLLFAGVLSTPAAQGRPLTLADAVTLSLERAPSLRAAEATLRVADANIAVANAGPNPTVSYENENVMGSGRYAGFGGGERTLSVAVPLELGGKRAARRRVAEAEQRGAGLGIVMTRSELVERVTEAFIAAAAARSRLALAGESLVLAQRAAHVANERVGVGKASPIEAQRADVVRINADVGRDKAARALALAEADLTRLTGAPLVDGFAAGWFDVAEGSSLPLPRTDALPLSLMAAEAQLATAAARVAAARSERVPDVTVTAGMRRYGDTSDRAAVLGISLPLPLFNQGTAAVARTQAEYDRVLADRDAAAQEAAQDVARAQAAVADAQAAAQAANGPAVAAAQEVARIARVGYASGKFPQLELIDAERSLAETREAAVDALAAFHLARARLARLQGSTDSLYKD
ncbi:TolC family protein [Massilia sp. YMA4]|uniref:TolC family protein n=1 Tax=Massilia sp. YMA4 TaxID=1593482 RepID=UPI000DD14FC3|nr:TolC family protein [Massilia sp. YMA4]AXA90824.1 TolC family protein [Massilia sp. YMA4]